MRMPDPGPLGETFFEARVRAMVAALLLKRPLGGCVESVVTFAINRFGFLAGMVGFLIYGGVPYIRMRKNRQERNKHTVSPHIRQGRICLEMEVLAQASVTFVMRKSVNSACLFCRESNTNLPVGAFPLLLSR